MQTVCGCKSLLASTKTLFAHNSPALSSNTKTMTTYSTLSFYHVLPTKTQISSVPNLRASNSCKATIHGHQKNDHGPTCQVKLDRRNVLLGLGGLALATQNFPPPFGVANAAEILPKTVTLVEASELPIALDSVISVVVQRPRKLRSKKEKEEEEEVLVIEGIEFVADMPLKFDVHVNDDENSLSPPDKSEFAGSLVYLLQSNKKVKTSLRLGITDLLDDLGADEDSSIKVTLVPRYLKRPVTIGRIKIDYLG